MEEFGRHNNQSMGPLPLDVISNILARLTVKYLFRLKSICKSWYALISSKQFINLHLLHNSVSSSDNLLVFSSNDHSLYSVIFGSLESPAMKLNLDNGLSFSGFGGSCNGLLLCFYNANNTSNSDVCLVNPSTMQYRKIPKLKLPRNYLCVNYGFGYDHKVDDYKVVRIVNFLYGCENTSVFNAREVMVYSLQANSWKFIEERISNYATLASRNGALVNNHLMHWMFWCTSKNEHRTSSFDICTEQWGEVPMPDYIESGFINGENRTRQCKKLEVVDLGILDGCLCLLSSNFRKHSSDVDLWIMKEYGVCHSWVKLLNVSDLNLIRPLNVVPVAYSRNYREILFMTEKELSVFWYDLREKRSTSVEISGLQDYSGVTICIQSIVSLDCYDKTDDKCRQRSTRAVPYAGEHVHEQY